MSQETATMSMRKWPEECRICHKKYPTKKSLQRHHVITHSTEKPFPCDMCSRAFKHFGNLTSHKKQMHSSAEAPHKCSTCNKSFWRPDTLKLHQLKHTGEKPFRCGICGKAFTSANYAKMHQNTHLYGKKDEDRVSCQICDKQFANLASVKSHVQSVHLQTPAEICIFCGKGYSDKSNLNSHLLRHTEERSFFCEFCGEGFFERCHRDKHKLYKHLSLFRCNYCRQGFSERIQLRAHIRTAHSETLSPKKAYLCVFCGFDLKAKQRLEVHLISHIHEQPHFCPHCDQCFSQFYGLKCHIKRLHLEI